MSAHLHVHAEALDAQRDKTVGSFAAQTISATPRQLESLIRLGEALARMRLSPTVTRADAAEALRLMQARCTPCRAPTSACASPAPKAPATARHLPRALLLPPRLQNPPCNAILRRPFPWPAGPERGCQRMRPWCLLTAHAWGLCFAGGQVALQQAATDPVTGAIDMDLIQTGVSASERIARAQLAQEIKALLLGALRCAARALPRNPVPFVEKKGFIHSSSASAA